MMPHFHWPVRLRAEYRDTDVG